MKGRGLPWPRSCDKGRHRAERGRDATYLVQPQAAEGSFHGQEVAQGGGAADVRRVGGVALHVPGVGDGHRSLSAAPAAPGKPAAPSPHPGPRCVLQGCAGPPHGGATPHGWDGPCLTAWSPPLMAPASQLTGRPWPRPPSLPMSPPPPSTHHREHAATLPGHWPRAQKAGPGLPFCSSWLRDTPPSVQLFQSVPLALRANP